jgi:hypothetical protein
MRQYVLCESGFISRPIPAIDDDNGSTKIATRCTAHQHTNHCFRKVCSSECSAPAMQKGCPISKSALGRDVGSVGNDSDAQHAATTHCNGTALTPISFTCAQTLPNKIVAAVGEERRVKVIIRSWGL